MIDTTITALAPIVASLVAAFVAWLAYSQGKKTHLIVNSRMQALLELTAKSSKAEGIKQEQDRGII